MVILSPTLEPKAYQDFYAEILVLHHPTTIQKNYQAMIHCGCIRQTATIINMDKESLRTGDKAKVHLRFLKNPEYIRPNQSFLFREAKVKAIGKVLSTITDTAARPATTVSSKKMKKMYLHNNKDDLNETDENDLNLKNKSVAN